jgi:chaperone BCS1
MSLPDQITSLLAGNQFLTGMIGATLTGAALFALRSAPGQLFRVLREAFSTTIVIDSDDQSYAHLNVWLVRHEASKRARRLMVAEAYDYSEGRWKMEITLGQGWHLLTVDGGLVIVHRHIQEADALGKALGGGKHQRFTITTLGRDQARLRSLIKVAEHDYKGRDMVEVLYWSGGCYEIADRRPARALHTIYLPEGQKTRLRDDLTAFIGSREEYGRKGVPWRRGYFLEGPPGTGKTSIVQALAGLIGRSVYVVNLNSLTGDNDLIRAVNQVGWDGLLLLEDIDAIKASHDREAPALPVPGLVMAESQKGVTLSGLLNAIDGLTAREGRILFMTSNHPDRLDPALIRPGRIDVREHLGFMDRALAWMMFAAYRPEGSASEFAGLMGDREFVSPAEMQGLLLNACPANDTVVPFRGAA